MLLLVQQAQQQELRGSQSDRMLYPGVKLSDLSEEQKQTIIRWQPCQQADRRSNRKQHRISCSTGSTQSRKNAGENNYPERV